MERAGINQLEHVRHLSRSQSKATYYPVEISKATADSSPPSQEFQYYHQGGLRCPLSSHPTSSSAAPPPRPLIHSQSVGMRFSPSTGGQQANPGPGFRPLAATQRVDVPLDLASVGGVTGYHDDLFLVSSPQSETCMIGGGTYPGEAGRSARNTPFMGLIDKTGRVYQQYQHQAPPTSSSCVTPSRTWAVSSLDTVVTSPSKTPTNHGSFSQPQPSSIAYHNRSNNNAHSCQLLPDNHIDYYEVKGQGESLVQVAGQNPSYTDVKLARTLPVIQSCSDRQADRQTGPTSPVKPKRPFVESNV